MNIKYFVSEEVDSIKELELFDKLILDKIIYLCNNGHVCFASNAYFSDLFGLSISTIRRSIKKLKEMDILKTEEKNHSLHTKRIITINYKKLFKIINKKKIPFYKQIKFKISFKTYKEYLKTIEWKEKRKICLKKANYKCQLCNSKKQPFQVHHRTYENIGNELENNDLIVLCKECHKKFHNIINEDK